MVNYYKILEIPDFSDQKAIKKAYRDLSKKYHPDVNKSEQAHQYFIVIKEAYEYLSEPQNKRYLDDILHRQKQMQSRPRTANQSSTTHNFPPKIHFFRANATHYSRNDMVVLEWYVEGAKSVEIDYLGAVNHRGKHGLKLKRVENELVVNMRVLGIDNQYYYQKISFVYRDKNPYIEAWRLQRQQNPFVDQEHFRPEQFFSSNGRIAVETFVQRISMVTLVFASFIWVSYWQDWMFVVYLNVFVYLSIMRATFSKRLHDLDANWSFFNAVGFGQAINRLFTQQGKKNPNNYGLHNPPYFLDFKEFLYKLRYKIPIIAPLTLAINVLMLIKGMSAYWQPIVQRKFSTADLINDESKDFYLVLDGTEYLNLESEIYFALKNGQYSRIDVNQMMFSGELNSVNFISYANPSMNQTIYYGFLGESTALLVILVFFLFLQWQIFRMFDHSLNKQQFSGMLLVIFIFLLYLWSLM